MRTKIYYYNLSMIVLFLFILLAGVFLAISYVKYGDMAQIQEKIDFQSHYVEKLQNTVFRFYHQKQPHFKDDIITMNKQYKRESKSLDTLSWFGMSFHADFHVAGEKVYQTLVHLGETRDILTATSKKIIKRYTQLGLDHKSGAYGALRIQAHILEREFKGLDNKTLQIILLTLRRHEKDFMLRGLNKYVTQFYQAHQLLQTYLKQHHSDANTVAIANTYRNYFNNFVRYATLLGLSEKPGLTQMFYTTMSAYQKQASMLKAQLNKPLTSTQHTLNILVGVIIGLLILIVLIYVFYKSEIKAAQERNPLTGLNGNNRIQEFLKNIAKSKEERSLVYFDFDYFKPFNDKFGFTQGDEAIHYFAERLKFYFNKPRFFIGHIGGDDFVVIVKRLPLNELQELIVKLQEDFKAFTCKYYTKEQISAQCIQAKDRFGVKRNLPLLEVSAAVVIVKKGLVYHSNKEISDVIADLKPLSKQEKIVFSSKI